MASGDHVLGRRLLGVVRQRDGDLWYAPQPGAYWRDGDAGDWWACTPNGMIGALSQHDVVEHADRTITVSPSILVDGETSYHGYLNRGEWSEC